MTKYVLKIVFLHRRPRCPRSVENWSTKRNTRFRVPWGNGKRPLWSSMWSTNCLLRTTGTITVGPLVMQVSFLTLFRYVPMYLYLSQQKANLWLLGVSKSMLTRFAGRKKVPNVKGPVVQGRRVDSLVSPCAQSFYSNYLRDDTFFRFEACGRTKRLCITSYVTAVDGIISIIDNRHPRNPGFRTPSDWRWSYLNSIH